MKALLLIAHGSRREQSNQEVKRLSQKLAQQGLVGYSIIHYGYLELAQPSISDAIIYCIESGASSVTVLPYFLSAGRHVSRDIPTEVARVQQQFPDISMTITAYLGSSDSMLSVLTTIAEDNL